MHIPYHACLLSFLLPILAGSKALTTTRLAHRAALADTNYILPDIFAYDPLEDEYDNEDQSLSPRDAAQPVPTEGSALLSLQDDSNIQNFTLPWNMSCSTTIIPDFRDRFGKIANVSMTTMWNDVQTSTDRTARKILRDEIGPVITYFDYVAEKILGEPPSDFVSPATAGISSDNGRELLWIRSTLVRIKDVF